jgi:Ca2+-binding RTX toxin-like protein
MTGPKIFIASKSPTPKKQHLYLVYDGDGDASTTGDQKVIRGGPEHDPVPVIGRVEIEVGVPMANSHDNYSGGDDHTDRNFTEVDVGAADPDVVWAAMEEAAEDMGSEGEDEDTVVVEVPYALLGPNSNSVIATILHRIGINIWESQPREGGTGDRIPMSTFTGANSYIGTSGNDVWVVKVKYPTIIVDQGGNDEYDVDVEAAEKGPLIIIEKGESGSSNNVTLRNAAPEDVEIYRSKGGDLIVIVNDKVLVVVPYQFKGEHPLLNTVTVFPEGGPPIVIPVEDPAEIPLFPPPALPAVPEEAKPHFDDAPNKSSPLVLDLDGDGVELTTFNGATTATFFDVDGDGFAEQTAWVGADDGLLARDIDESGTIDSVVELFGSPGVDGFALLAEFDSNGDHLIDQYDNVWSELIVWQDTNGDAETQSGELYSLSGLGIVSFDLASVAASTSTIGENPISHTSTYSLAGGSTRAIVDAWFVHDNANTHYIGEYDQDVRTLFLPTLRGYGTLTELRVAMAANESLFELVQDFAAGWDTSRFEDGVSLDADIEEILWTWAGVENVASSSRGGEIDARHLEFLEEFFGEEFIQNGGSSNPYVNAAAELNLAWERLFYYLKAQLIVQVGAESVFDGTISYNVYTGEFEGEMILSQDAVDNLEAAAPASGAPLRHYWEQVGEFLAFTKGFGELETAENTMMDDAITATDAGLSWTDIITTSAPAWLGYTITGTPDDDTVSGTSGNDTLNGGAGHDTISGSGGDDILNGGTGNDVINGGADNDIIHGNEGDDILNADGGNNELYGDDGADILHGSYSGNDILNGGAGGDTVFGYQGDDTYQYTSGDDIYEDTYGADTITLPSGITSGNISFFQIADGSNYGVLTINVGTLGTIQTDFFTTSGTLYSGRIETLMFSNTTTFDFSAMTALTTYGTADSNGLYGVNVGSHVDDTMYGLDGNDQLTTYAGNDTLDGGNGNDRLIGGTGNDTYIASPGFDRIEWDDGGTDTIWLPAGYSAGDLTIIKTGTYDIEIGIAGLGQIKIEGQLYSGYEVESISFNGVSTLNLTTAQIEQVGGTGADTLNGITAGASIDDIMDGREGDDVLNGNMGDDTYFFSVGDDQIGEQGGTDTLAIREAWAPEDITLYRQGFALYVEDQNGNSMKVQQQFTLEGGTNYSAYEIEEIVFSDSTTWSLDSIEIETRGTSSGETIGGTTGGDASSADTLYGLGGVDTLTSGAGNDTLYGGDGADNLWGGAGADVFMFELATAFNDRDDVKDFSAGDGDIIDLTDILGTVYDPLTDAISDFVSLTTGSGSTVISVDRDGTGSTYSMAEVVRLYGTTGLGTAENMETNGNLLAA